MHPRCLRVAAVARHNRLQEGDGWAPSNFFSCHFLEAGKFCCWLYLPCWYVKPFKHHLKASPFLAAIVRETGRGMKNRFRSFCKIHLISSLCLPTASSKWAHYRPFKGEEECWQRASPPCGSCLCVQYSLRLALSDCILSPTLAGFLAKKSLLFEAPFVPGQLVLGWDPELVIK